MILRSALTPALGKPDEEFRDFFVKILAEKIDVPRDVLRTGTEPGQIIYLAAGLAEWDAQVTKRLSPQTEAALSLMFDLQATSGTWWAQTCWPPYESDAFHEATVAAMAVSTAPGWLRKARKNPRLAAGVARLRDYLRTTAPPHDYGRVLLLWAATKMPNLLRPSQRQAIVQMLLSQQRSDGGWSIRTFASPKAWGDGSRAARLNAESGPEAVASDGHQTGLAVLVLREAGVRTSHPAIQRGVAWLLANQRVSGRWWTRSLNTDESHFITYSGTALPLLALARCDALPAD